MVPNKRATSNEQYHKQIRPYSNNRRSNKDFGWRHHANRMDLDIQKSRPNNILRIKILNAFYEVTTETLHFVFSRYGDIQRIVLFKSAGVQSAMIEYDSVEAATIARDYLNGFNIFLSCNTLQIEFAWTSQLVVTSNDINKCWDYTVDFALDAANGFNRDQGYWEQPQYFQSEHSSESSNKYQPMITFSTTPQNEPNILIVSGVLYGLSNAFKLFNLFSLYGNVAKIQFQSTPGTAVVQMFDQMSVECCLRHLNQLQVAPRSQLNVSWTNQAFQPIEDRAFMMPDGSCSFQDFTYSKNQRFLVPRPNYWIQAPSNVLRFYNTPKHATIEMMMAMFSSENVSPKSCVFLPVEDGSRTSRGLLEFCSVPQAVQAVMRCNNKDIVVGPNNVHYLKLAFSSNNSFDSNHQNVY